MTEVIAFRTFWWANAPDHKLVVRIGKPSPDPEGYDNYFCPIETSGFGDAHIDAMICGVDAYQALELAMRYLEGRLWDINEKSGGLLRWDCGQNQRIPEDWKAKPTRYALDLQISCARGHGFELQSGLSRDRRTNEILIHCPICKVSVGGLGHDYPDEWLPPTLRRSP